MKYYSQRRGICNVNTVIVKKPKNVPRIRVVSVVEPKEFVSSVDEDIEIDIDVDDSQFVEDEITQVTIVSEDIARKERLLREENRFNSLVATLFNDASRYLVLKRINPFGLKVSKKLLKRHEYEAEKLLDMAATTAWESAHPEFIGRKLGK